MSFLTRWLTPPPEYEPPETRDWSIADPSISVLFGASPTLAGTTVSELTVLSIPAVKAAVSIIAGSIASLPLQTIVTAPDGTSQRVPSFLDDPGKVVGITEFEWKETVVAHLLIHGNAFLGHIRGGAGQLLGLQPIHPGAVGVEVGKKTGVKTFRVSLADGTSRVYADAHTSPGAPYALTHIPALSLDGVRGLSPLQVARNMFGTAIAAEHSAAKLFKNGALMSAIVTPATDTTKLTPDQAIEVKQTLDHAMAGGEHAGEIAVFNRALNITPWSLTASDAQWIEARSFQIEEIARWFQIPPHLLAQTEKQTSWGSGVTEQNRGLARYNLEAWTTRIQERLSWLLDGDRKVEFLYTAFLEPDPETEIALLIEQAGGPYLTVNEVRKIKNLPPIEGGDVLRTAVIPPGQVVGE